MTHPVEGEWKEFVFQMAKDEDTPRILEHMRKNFYRDEPLCKHLGYDEDTADDFDTCVKGALEAKLSFIVLDKVTNKVAGVRVTTLVRRNDHSELPALKSWKTYTIINFLTKASNVANVFEAYPDVDSYADFFMASVDAEFRGKGLVTEMYNRAIKLFQDRGIKLCKSVITSPYTRKACANLGFAEHSRLYLKDYKDEQGNLHFPNAQPDEIITVVANRV